MQKKKYKALLLDLDGTTVKLQRGSLPSEKVRFAIHELSKKTPVCIVTGRPIDDTIPILHSLGLDSPCIMGNGSIVFDVKHNRVLAQHTIDLARVKQIVEICKDKTSDMYVQTIHKEIHFSEYDGKQELAALFVTNLSEQSVNNYLEVLQEKVKNLAMHAVLKATFSGNPMIAIHDIHGTKQHALLHLIKMLHVEPEEIVAVGDAENDLPMIIAAGMGVAMGNAGEGIKSVADWIAPSVDEDGVVAVIEKYF